MVLRFSNFKGKRLVHSEQAGRTTVARFELAQRATLSGLTPDELRSIRNQCEDILYGRTTYNEIYVSNITKIEEVSNE